jgi:hypothetical protein
VLYAAVRPSTIFKPISALKRGDRVLLAFRESHQNCSLANQARVLRPAARDRGIVVAGEIARDHMTGKGGVWLSIVAAEARRLGVDKVLVTSWDRAYRPDRFYAQDGQFVPLTRVDVASVRQALGGIEVFTMLDPDMPLRKIRGVQSTWGQKSKGGRPPGQHQGPGSEQRGSYIGKHVYFELATKLVIDCGLSPRKAAQRVNGIGSGVTVSPLTVARWVELAKRGEGGLLHNFAPGTQPCAESQEITQ